MDDVMQDRMIDSLLDAMPMPAMLVWDDQRVGASNAAMRDILGFDPQDRLCAVVIRNPAVLECVERSLGSGERSQTEFVYQDRGRDIRYQATAARLEARGRTAILLSFEDITSMLGAMKMRRDFVANVSHELRTPLTALLGYMETLRGPAKDDPVARERFIHRMYEEAGRMRRLIEDLLSLSRVENEERVRPSNPLDIAEIAQAAIRQVAYLIDDTDTEVSLQSPIGAAIVLGDADQLRQVFVNLIENAIKYGNQPGKVTVSIRDATSDPELGGPAYAVDVADDGPGIDPLHVPRLTERFYRVDDHRSRAVGGTGLGLAIVKHIVNRHRGRFLVRSVPGKGSTMTVLLPKAPA